MKVGLYFGTFNPIHVGHLTIANHLAEHSDLDQVWFVVTPHSPFKKKSSLLDDHQRLEMVYLATKDYPKLKQSDIEFKLPQPNYTINTLTYLEERHPDYLSAYYDVLESKRMYANNMFILKDEHFQEFC